MLMTLALRGYRLRSSWHTVLAWCGSSNRFWRLSSVDQRQLLPAYQPVILASVLDRSVMQYDNSFPPTLSRSCNPPTLACPNRRHRTRSGPKKDTPLKRELRRERKNEEHFLAHRRGARRCRAMRSRRPLPTPRSTSR